MATKKTKTPATTIRSAASVSRRELLQRSAALGVSASALSAVPAAVNAQTSPPSTEAPAANYITIEDMGANLQSEPSTLRWLDSGPAPRATFQQAFFTAYEQARPNVSVEYEQADAGARDEVISLGIQSGNAHDCFLQPTNVTAGQMVREGWVRPLDDVIPNFEEWKSRYPPGVLVEGITIFGGKTYCCPYLSSRQLGTLLLYNVEYMERAGYDPTTTLSWDEFRDAARTMSEQGGGEYFGWIFEGASAPNFADIVSNLAALAGEPTGDFSAIRELNWKTGEFSYTSDAFLAAVELILAMQADGSVFPGALQLNGPQARGQFAQGAAGIILQGPWNISEWQRDFPDFNFGVASPPMPNGELAGRISYGPGATLPVWLNAETNVAEIAGDIFANISSEANQRALVEITGGFPPPLLVDPTDVVDLGPRETAALELSNALMRVGPSPLVRNPDAEQVALELQRVTPNFGETMQGLFAGQLNDPMQAMQGLKDRSDQELERAINAARENGANVSRDDFVFPNWNPMEEYTEEDYAEL